MTLLENLIQHMARLPGVGKKSASRIAFYLLKSDENFNRILSDEIRELQAKIIECSLCRNYTDVNPCAICSSEIRNKKLLCLVEESQDLFAIESGGIFDGLFFVLHGVISPMEGLGPRELRLDFLARRIEDEGISEVIIATNPTPEGDTTALYLARFLAAKGLKVTRLASGLPVGGDIEYMDRLTLARSFQGRRDI